MLKSECGKERMYRRIVFKWNKSTKKNGSEHENEKIVGEE
jgi:hypothetical protein